MWVYVTIGAVVLAVAVLALWPRKRGISDAGSAVPGGPRTATSRSPQHQPDPVPAGRLRTCDPERVTPTEPRATRWGGPLVADLACVLALAVAGKSSHEAGASGWVVLAIAWPYALAAALAHAWLLARGRPTHRAWPEGATVLAVTYALGMLLRAVSGRGLAPAFLVVAGAFLAVTMLGWRVVVLVVARRRST